MQEVGTRFLIIFKVNSPCTKVKNTTIVAEIVYLSNIFVTQVSFKVARSDFFE